MLPASLSELKPHKNRGQILQKEQELPYLKLFNVIQEQGKSEAFELHTEETMLSESIRNYRGIIYNFFVDLIKSWMIYVIRTLEWNIEAC